MPVRILRGKNYFRDIRLSGIQGQSILQPGYIIGLPLGIRDSLHWINNVVSIVCGVFGEYLSTS